MPVNNLQLLQNSIPFKGITIDWLALFASLVEWRVVPQGQGGDGAPCRVA
jgi:hypothetical protein